MFRNIKKKSVELLDVEAGGGECGPHLGVGGVGHGQAHVRGHRPSDMAAPATPRPAPTRAANVTRGRRTSVTTSAPSTSEGRPRAASHRARRVSTGAIDTGPTPRESAATAGVSSPRTSSSTLPRPKRWECEVVTALVEEPAREDWAEEVGTVVGGMGPRGRGRAGQKSVRMQTAAPGGTL